MNTRLSLCLMWLATAFAAPGLAIAGGSCGHPTCGPRCHAYVVDSHRDVPEVGFREVRYKVWKLRCRTDLVPEKTTVVSPVLSPVVVPGHAEILVPKPDWKTWLEACKECREETVVRPVTVDAGHWACGPRKCGHVRHHKAGAPVWVPNPVVMNVPTQEEVCREVLVPRVKEEWHEVPTRVDFAVHTTARRLDVEDVVRHVPKTTEEWVEEAVVIRVPFVSSRCVSCRHVIDRGEVSPRTSRKCDDGCGLASHHSFHGVSTGSPTPHSSSQIPTFGPPAIQVPAFAAPAPPQFHPAP